MDTDDVLRRMDDALLASVMRKLLADESTWVEAWTGGPNHTHAYVQVDGTVAVTPEESDACQRVREEAQRDEG